MPKPHAVNRREFLKGAAVSAAGALAAPYVLTSTALGAPGVRPASERITTCSIGLRNRGGQILGSVLGDQEAQVVAICDVDAAIRGKFVERVNGFYGAKAGKDWKGCDAYNDFRDVLARQDIDAIVLATPDHTHALIAVSAMKAGKDVFCEKPMTLTIREGRVMSDTARRYGRILQVGSQRRSEAGVRRMCELVRNGRIGKVHTVEVGWGIRPGSPCPWSPEPVPEGFDYDLWLGPAPWEPYNSKRCHYNFRFVRDYSGGEMTNWGAHFFDVAQWGLGMDDSGPVEVTGTGQRHATGLYDTYYRIDVKYTYANGVVMHANNQFKGTRFIGEEGEVGGGRTQVTDSEIGPDDIHLYETRRGHMGNFFECVRSRRLPSADVEIGHRSATICHLGNAAIDLGRTLRWDPKAETFPGDDEANRLIARPYRQPWKL